MPREKHFNRKERNTMSEYIRKSIDVAGMLEALLEISMDVWKKWGHINSSNEAWAVADYKTIGVTAGRQCGLTRGAFEFMARRPNQCIHITKDQKMCDAHRQNNAERGLIDNDDYISLVPCITKCTERWTAKLEDEQIKQIRFIIVDDAAITLSSSYLNRAMFNKWVAETFHKDTFVILIK